MANHIYVLCRSADPLPLGELENYIATIGLLDEPPRFNPPLNSSEAKDPGWTYVEMAYAPKKRPIQLHRLNTPDQLGPAVEDALSFLSEHAEPRDHPQLVDHIRSARQAFHFEFGSQLPDDCWEMLDATESYIAKALSGVVFASNGFYDSNLQPIVEWK